MVFLTVIIFAGLFFLRGDNGVTIDLQTDEAVTVDGPQGSLFSVRYEEIAEMTLLDSFARGECIDGGTKRGYSYGTWSVGALEEYTLIVRDKVDSCIVITDRGGRTLVFNYESDEVTANLYELILGLWEEQGGSLRTGA